MRTNLLCVMAVFCLLFVAVNVQAETCQYKTQWGVLTIDTNGSNATGSYPHHNGKISGTMKYPNIQGTWTQDDGTGNFQFVLYRGGFTGNWNYTGEKTWRGAWDGTLIRCY